MFFFSQFISVLSAALTLLIIKFSTTPRIQAWLHRLRLKRHFPLFSLWTPINLLQLVKIFSIYVNTSATLQYHLLKFVQLQKITTHYPERYYFTPKSISPWLCALSSTVSSKWKKYEIVIMLSQSECLTVVIHTSTTISKYHSRYFTVTFFYSPDHKNLKEKNWRLSAANEWKFSCKETRAKKSCTMQFFECVFL